MNGPWPLIADVGDLIGFLIFLLFLIISVVGSLANKWRQMQEEAARRGRPPRPQQPPRQPRPLDDEIADFLRTAGERREAGRPRPGGGPAGAPPPRPAATHPSQPPTPPPRPRPEEPLEVKPLETGPRRLVEALATRTLASSSLGQLTSDIAQADDRRESRLRQAFPHDLSTLSAKPSPGPSPPAETATPLPPTAAAGLTALLASGANLRNAVILSEIINRPEHRWK